MFRKHTLCMLYLLHITAATVSGLGTFREESEIVFPAVLPSNPGAGAEAGATSREVRSISAGADEYEWQEFYPGELQPLLVPAQELQLKIPAFGRELYLSLRRDSRFLSGSFTVHSRRDRDRDRDREGGRSRSSVLPSRAELSCYYSGFVHSYRGSLASFSTCGGL
ncbi:hypothetical protein chiPu_0023135, partial [Chiloscyllium punctatum]|nr:hypothetical protein [Chiloscyllium punctatum]